MDGAESECCSGRRKESKAGSMTRVQIIASTTALLAVVSIAAPGVARAGSLLSGYGGPGQGNQEILGSALLNGPSGGGGGSGNGGSGGSAGGSSSGLAESSSQEATSTGRRPAEVAHATVSKHGSAIGGGASGRGPTFGGGSGHASGASRAGAESRTHGRSEAAEASGGIAGAYPASAHGEAARLASDHSETLGLSVQDLLYILLALGMLAFTGVLTAQLKGFAATRRHG
jgi:hypothetical protein